MTSAWNWHNLARVIMEEKLGRSLLLNEDVHHKDGDITNVEDVNLEVMLDRDHTHLHKVGKSHPGVFYRAHSYFRSKKEE